MLISKEQEAQISLVFESYVTEHHHEDILQLISDTEEDTHHAVVVNAMTLFEANMEVGDYFNAYPKEVLVIFDKVLQKTALELMEKTSTTQCGGQRIREQKMRKTPHARITGLPVCPELTRDTIPRSRDVGHFLSVTGTVIRTSVTKVLEYKREYMCVKCRHVFTLEADFDQFYIFAQPATCPSPDGCNSYKFTCLSEGSEPAACRDYQEIKIQEQVQRLSVGSIPRSMLVVLEDDLVDSCKSGDDVTVYGVMCRRWKPLSDGTPCDVELVLKANNIEVNNQQAVAALVMKDVMEEFEDFWNSYAHDPIAGRNQILLSLCPQVFGMYVIKLAVAMVLAGGVQRKDSSGSKIRGECHMLLVGDPGTGKSQFLKYTAKIMPRSVLTAGIGSTSAGLTVAAVRDGGEWHLEAGALVLSDGGLCCIDEFNSIREQDRISIHEAMEQQSISVAKAGMVCKLNTRTTILAAANPKGQYNSNEPLSVNVALASPLLSRFDLVLVLLDTKNAEWDRVISSFILEDRALPSESPCLWSMEKMKAYFSVIRRLQPQVSEEANSILTRYYQLQRQSNSRNAARTTIRMLESLSRLAEGHARLMYRETVTIEDAVMAVSVMECSMQGGALLGNVNAVLTSFPSDAAQQYETQCQVLLEGLNLPLLLHKEMSRLAGLKENSTEASPPPDSTINKTPRHGVTSSGKGDVISDGGLDWFHSISPSQSANGMTSPVLTSTQEHMTRKENPSWSDISMVKKQPNNLTETNTSSRCLTVNQDVNLNASGTFTSASEGKNKDKSAKAQSETMHSGRQGGDRPQSPGCVFQKVSKKVRHKRLRELELTDQQCDQREWGDEGLCTDVVSNKSGTATELHGNTSLSPGKDSGNEKVDNRDRTGTETPCAGLGEKMAAQSSEELHAKLSSFIFKPKRMKPSTNIPNRDTISNAGDEFQTDKNPSKRNLHNCRESRINNQMPVNHDPLDTKMSRGKERLSLGGSRRNQVSSVGEMDGGTSEISLCSKGLLNDVPSGEKVQTLCRLEENRDELSQQQRPLAKAKELKSKTCTPNPPNLLSTDLGDQAPSRPEKLKSTVASSTLAKLSRFSFNGATELTTPTKVDKPPLGAVGGRPALEIGQCPGTSTEDRRTQNKPEHNPLGHEIKSVNIVGNVKADLQPPAPPTHPAHPGDSADQNSVNVKKRRCFELGPASSSAADSRVCFTRHSLFSSVESSNDVFDTDWDQVVSKKAKI